MTYLANPVAEKGQPITFKNPSNIGSTLAAVGLQIRNASAYVVSVVTVGSFMIEPFSAATLPISLGQDVIVVPLYLAYPNLPNYGYVSAEWIAANEYPSQPDGPLTSAATIAATQLAAPTPFQATPTAWTPTIPLTLVAMSAVFSASAVVANRNVGFDIVGPSSSSYWVQVLGPVVASEIVQMNAAQGSANAPAPVAGQTTLSYSMPLLYLDSTYTVNLISEDGQTGDSFTSWFVFYRPN